MHLVMPTITKLTYITVQRDIISCGGGGGGGGGVGWGVRRWWVNFLCRVVLLIWMRVGQGPTVLAVGAGGGCLDIFSLFYHFSFLSPSFWERAQYRLKYCLKGPLSPKQPTISCGVFCYLAVFSITQFYFHFDK